MKLKLRYTTATNPLGLELGEKVLVNRTCTVDYDSEGRKLLRYAPVFPITVVVVGAVRKALGAYLPRLVFSPGDYNYAADDAQATLKVHKYVRLYEVKSTITGGTFLVHPDDIEIKS